MVVVHCVRQHGRYARADARGEEIRPYGDRGRHRGAGTKYTEGEYAGRMAGTIGDIGVYSFNGNKIITTGSGGMVVSNHSDWLEHARHLSTQAKSDELNYLHDEWATTTA